MTGFHTYVDDELIDADDMNGLIRDQVNTIFSSTGARDSAITSPVHGQLCTVAPGGTPPTTYVYDGSTSAWVAVGGTPNPVTFAWLNETHTVTSNATPAADTKLTLTLLGGKTYTIDAWLLANADSVDTVNLRVTWVWTGDSLTGSGRHCDGPAPTIAAADPANSVDDTVFQGFTGITDEVVYGIAVNGLSSVHEHLTVRTPASGGTLTLAWAQGTSNADAIHLFAPSHLRAEYADASYDWEDEVEIG